jgi:hypothetical protein
MSLLFEVDPAKVLVTLIEMPIFQWFFLSSLFVVFIYSVIMKITKPHEKDSKNPL